MLKPTKPMSGFIELTPLRQRCFDECARRMQAVLRGAGFARLDLPSIERAEVLTDKDNWDEIETQMFLFQKGDTKMGLRYDGTIGLARYVAGNANDLAFPFRAYQFAKNYRGERPQKGRFREFYQMDADILGINSLSKNYDAEIVAVLSDAYATIEEFVGPTKIKVGSRPFWNAMFAFLGLDAAAARQAFVLIDKKDKLGDDFPAALREVFFPSQGGNGGEGPQTQAAEGGPVISAAAPPSRALRDSPPQGGGQKSPADAILDVFSKGYRAAVGLSPELTAAVKELDDFVLQLAAMGIKNAEIDLAVMRGHAYYTGVVFEFFLTKFPDLGAVGGGGRYEDLAEKFSKTKIIGVGAAIGFSRMLATLLEADEIDLSGFASPVDAAVLVLGQENTTYAMSVLVELRKNDIVVIPFLDTDKKARAQFEFADKISAKYSVIIGDNEAKNQVLTLKDMKTGNQTGEKLSDAIKIIEKSK